MRHNNIRDLEAEPMKEICFDIKVEPELLSLDTKKEMAIQLKRLD